MGAELWLCCNIFHLIQCLFGVKEIEHLLLFSPARLSNHGDGNQPLLLHINPTYKVFYFQFGLLRVTCFFFCLFAFFRQGFLSTKNQVIFVRWQSGVSHPCCHLSLLGCCGAILRPASVKSCSHCLCLNSASFSAHIQTEIRSALIW